MRSTLLQSLGSDSKAAAHSAVSAVSAIWSFLSYFRPSLPACCVGTSTKISPTLTGADLFFFFDGSRYRSRQL